MATHPFRFGFQSFNTESAQAWRDKAKQAEDLGYSVFHLADHYIGAGPAIETTNHPIQDVAAIPAMAVAAEATSTIGIGCRVFCTGYRPVPILAKEVFTLDFFSEGRLELGLGAGWLENEYKAMGIPFESPGKRIDLLAESIQLMKAHMTGEELNIQGEYVHAVGYQGVPKPPRGKIPIMIGGGGKRVLSLAAREADIVSLNFNNRAGVIGPDGVGSSTAEETEKKISWLKDAAGVGFDNLEIEIGAYFTVVTDQGAATAAGMGQMFGLSGEDMARHPHALIGSVDEICEELERRRETYGISYVTVGGDNMESFAPVVAKLAGK
ncbi:MAG: TIGR03621 family F420-dependent LLM class oxidoreductase [Pseudomonadota bacterium]